MCVRKQRNSTTLFVMVRKFIVKVKKESMFSSCTWVHPTPTKQNDQLR